MSEGSNYRENAPTVKIDNVSRLPRPEGGLPPLMEDVRATHLASSELPESHGKVYLKAVGAPYTGEHGVHFLAIPDAPEGRDLPGVKDLSTKDLAATLQFGSAIAEKTFANNDIHEVDFGWHHSRAELIGIPKQRQATFPKNLHMHVLGFSQADMQEVATQDVVRDRELRGKIGDEYLLHKFGEEIFSHEIVDQIRSQNLHFNELFEETKDQRGRLAYKMKAGIEGFSDPALAEIIQFIDKRAKEEYDKLGKCFFVPEESGDGFKTKPKTEENSYERYELLPKEQRQANVDHYLEDHQWLSEPVKRSLTYLASQSQDETAIIDRELEKARVEKGSDLTSDEITSVTATAANRFWAYKDLTYSMVWSAKKTEDNTDAEWLFRFDPAIFTVDGIVKSSPNTTKIITKGTDHYTPEQLSLIHSREREIISASQEKHPEIKTGPGIAGNA